MSRIDVILHAEAVGLIAPHLSGLMKGGSYFNCASVEQDGSFLHLEIEVKHPRTSELIPFRISIPTSYVLYMIKATKEAKRALGFGDQGESLPPGPTLS
jgi:hypothetical protein